MKYSILIVVHSNFEKISLMAAQIAADNRLPDVIKANNLNEISPEKVRNKFEEFYPEEKQNPFKFELKAYEPMGECFVEKPKKPRYNPKTNKVTYF